MNWADFYYCDDFFFNEKPVYPAWKFSSANKDWEVQCHNGYGVKLQIMWSGFNCNIPLRQFFFNCFASWIYFLAVFMYLSERYLEILQNADVEEPKSSQHKNGMLNWFCLYMRNTISKQGWVAQTDIFSWAYNKCLKVQLKCRHFLTNSFNIAWLIYWRRARPKTWMFFTLWHFSYNPCILDWKIAVWVTWQNAGRGIPSRGGVIILRVNWCHW